MPQILPRYAPADQKWWRETEEAGNKERDERRKRIETLWRYYEGEQKKPLKVKPGRPDLNVILNLSGEAINKMVAFVGQPRFELAGGTDRKPNAFGMLENTLSPQQQALNDWWATQEPGLLLTDLYLSGFIAGHNYLKLVEHPQRGVDVELIDPQIVTAYWQSPSRRDGELFYRMQWQVGNETRIQDIVPDWLFDGAPKPEGGAMEWVIVEYVKRSGGKLEQIGLDEWLFPFAPIIDWKNLPLPFKYYGASDFDPRLNDSVNLVASNLNKIVFHHAGPQTVLTGGSLPDEVEAGPDKIIELENEKAKLYNLEMQGDLGQSMSFLNLLKQSFFSQTRVLDTSSIKDKAGQLTNFAVRMLYTDQLDAAYLKHLLYGSGLAEAARRSMLVLGVDPGTVTSVWEDPLPQDRKELVESVKVEHDMRMTSEQTLLEELGRKPEVEAERKAEEGERQDEAVAATLTRIGNRGLFG